MINFTKKFTSAVLSLAFVAIVATAAVAQSNDDSWTGVYVGGNLGVGVGRTAVNTSTVYNSNGYFEQTSPAAVNAKGAQTIESSRFTGGAQGGYNKQFGRFVIGAEADINLLRSDNGVVSGDVYPCCSTQFTITQEVKTNWVMTARPRFGVTAGKALVYVTGGLAVGDVEYNAVFEDNDSDALETASFKKNRVGYAAGAGVEFKLSKRWSAKGEYLFTDLGRATETSNNLTTTFFGSKDTLLGGSGIEEWPENPFTHSVRVKNHNLRFGINYRF